jgi:hypothetical protein
MPRRAMMLVDHLLAVMAGRRPAIHAFAVAGKFWPAVPDARIKSGHDVFVEER